LFGNEWNFLDWPAVAIELEGAVRQENKVTMRTGGEILFDRPAWQALYGKS
jgi:hypothetical protein